MLDLSEVGLIVINCIIFVLSIFFSCLYYFYPYLKNKSEQDIKSYYQDNKSRLICSICFFVLFITRLFLIDKFPGGYNQDEASSAYDAYSIMMTGKDRAGNFLPVHLVAWGSGQNALYSYLMIPFIALFGLNEFSSRLPMGIIGVVSVLYLYKFLKKYYKDTTALVVLCFFVISPWHIMKSRWGLESNLFPDLVLIAVCLFMDGINGNKIKFYLSAFVFALSSYSYGTAYFFLFFFIIAIILYCFIIKKIKWYEATIYLSEVFIVCLPIMLFILINTNDLPSMKFICFTIPKLTQNRFKTVTNLFSNDFFETSIENFKNGIALLITQNDNLPWNCISLYGVMYIFSLPFFVVGLFVKYEEKVLNVVMKIWLIVCLLMLFIVSSNINRINIIFIPMIYFSALGIKYIINYSKLTSRSISVLYIVSFLCFSHNYVNDNQEKIKSSFFYSFNDALRFASDSGAEKIYVTSTVNMPYIFTLFTARYDVNDYVNTREISNPGSSFEWINHFGNYYFYLPNVLEDNACYVVKKGEKSTIILI